MAQSQLMQIKLSRFDAQPWGFRLQGGVDFAAPLLVQKVNGGSLAEQAGLLPGDAVIKINDVDVFNLRHKDAQDIVVRSGNNFVVTVQRGGSTWRPHVTPTGHVPQPNQNSPYLQTVTKTSLAHKQQDSQHIGCGYNNAARPFVNGGDGSVKSIVNKQYNTPVGIYSDESIAETLSAQAEVLAGGVLGVNFKKNEKEYQADKSEVLKFLREEETGQSTPEPHSPANFYWTHSHAIGGNERRTTQTVQQQQQQQQVQKTTEKRVSTSLVQSKVASSSTATNVSASNASSETAVAPATVATPSEKTDPRIIMMPVCPALQGPEYKAEMEAAAAALAHDDGQRPLSASGHPACQLCGVGIVGVFVRIKDKNLHVECFKCATCGTSLKNQGYYNFNNKLYCDIHAKLAAMQNPPVGTEGYVPVPIKPNTKLSASTISSALNAHGYNGVSNGNSTPTPAPVSAPQEDTADYSLPPPPSPTQLQQFENDSQFYANNQNNHTHTHSSLSSLSSASSLTSSMSSPTPDNYIASLPPPPPPPPMPMDRNEANLYINTNKIHDHNGNNKMLQQNENDMNTYNKNVAGLHAPTNTVYNKFLKEYSNKLLSQANTNNNNNNISNSNNGINSTATQNNNKNNINHTNILNNNDNKLFNGTAKPYTTTHTPASSTTNVAAVSAALANQLKFNPCQVANPLATTAANIAAPATTVEIIKQDTTTANMAATFENNDQSIYGQINTNVQPSSSATGDQPFEYVTLTGNVIRSVVPPGKGVNLNYKVNQGYARPFGAAPPSAAPKSPISYPPQPQQWASPPQQQAPKPASNPYATLPRSNVGQQEPCLQTNTLSATLPRHPNAANMPDNHDNAVAEPNYNDEATAMLTESIGKINMGNKMNNFMAEAGKIISNMLEARLANSSGQQSLSNSGSTLSLRSNSSSNLSKSPMVMRKRFELDDFKDIDPTEPVSLKPVVAMQPITQSPSLNRPKAQPQAPKSLGALTTDLPVNHPMGKLLDICDNGTPNKREVIYNAAKPAGGTVHNTNGNANQFPPAPPPMPVSSVPKTDNKIDANNTALPPTEVVVFRNNGEQNNKRTGRGGELSTHAMDRRSYIEPNAQNESILDGPAFSISVKALGRPNEDENTTMSPENEEVVSQLLKDGKRPICCQCNNEIKKGPFITALGRIWCPEHFICVNANCRRPLQDIGFVEEKGDLYCEYCFEKYLAPTCSKCCTKIKGDCLNAIGKHFHPECFTCGHCGKLFGNTPFFLEDGNAYCEADWNELFTTKCFACGFPVEAGDRWVEALNHNYHSQCFNCSYCKQNLEGQSFYNKGGRPFCKNHAR